MGALLGQDTRTAKARVTLPNPKMVWRPGLFVNVDVVSGETEVPVSVLADAVQTVGKLPINLAELPVDYLALSGHKLHAPKGVGALYVRRGALFRPFLRGGHQERGRRSGTENSASIVGLGVAAKQALEHMAYENMEVRRLRDRLEAGILPRVPRSRRRHRSRR